MSQVWDNLDNQAISAAKLPVGTGFTGKLLELVPGKFDKVNLRMEDDEGNEFFVFTAGTLAYKAKDGKLFVGKTYRVTRTADTPTKGKDRSNFTVECLREDGSVAVPKVNTEKPAGKSK